MAQALAPPKLDILYTFRPTDKHLNLKYVYPGQEHKFVEAKDCDTIKNIFTAMQHEDLIKLHGKERYKLGERGVKEPNPEYAYYPGYGNHKDADTLTLDAARCLEVTLQRLREHAGDSIHKYKFTAMPERKGDPPVIYETEDAFKAYIDSVPEPADDDDGEPEPPGWRDQVNARLARIEVRLGIVQAE